MKKLVMAAAVFDKDSVFDPEKCFNYQHKTYEVIDDEHRKALAENIPDRAELSEEEIKAIQDEMMKVKYRFVIGPDDYDYVTAGAVLPGVTPNPFETKESTEKYAKELDAAWERWQVPTNLKEISYEQMCEMKDVRTLCGPIPDGVDPKEFVMEQHDFYAGDYTFEYLAILIYPEVKVYPKDEAMYERTQGSYWLLSR